MPAIARLGDPITCGDTLAQGSGNVFINGLPISRVLIDFTAGHGCNPPTQIANGASTVFANGHPVVMMGDSIVPHHCPDDSPHTGTILASSPNVFCE